MKVVVLAGALALILWLVPTLIGCAWALLASISVLWLVVTALRVIVSNLLE